MKEIIFDIVFLIDDDEATNFYNQIMVEKSGVASTIEVFDSPLDALNRILNLFENEEYKRKKILILLDINMPKMNGWQFLTKLEEAQFIDCNIFNINMLSASINQKDIEKSKSFSIVNKYLTKPLNLDKIHSLITEK